MLLEVDYRRSLAFPIVRMLWVDGCGGPDLLKICAFISL